PSCTCTPRPCATGWVSCASCSGTASLTQPWCEGWCSPCLPVPRRSEVSRHERAHGAVCARHPDGSPDPEATSSVGEDAFHELAESLVTVPVHLPLPATANNHVEPVRRSRASMTVGQTSMS